MHKTKTIMQKLLASILTLAMVFGMMPAMTMEVEASGTGDFTVAGGTLNDDYSYADNTLTILTGTALTISGTTTTDKIVVNEGITANITLAGVDIQFPEAGSGTGSTPMYIYNASANITLAQDTINTLKGGLRRGAIEFAGGDQYTLTIGGTGTLNVTGGYFRGGITTTDNASGGFIVINGGIINADGFGIGSGIGATSNRIYRGITINGGTITTSTTAENGTRSAYGLCAATYASSNYVTVATTMEYATSDDGTAFSEYVRGTGASSNDFPLKHYINFKPAPATPPTYTVTFYLNGGNISGSTSSLDVAISPTMELPADPTRDGYTFDGWYYAEPPQTKLSLDDMRKLTSSTTVSAKWKKVITTWEELQMVLDGMYGGDGNITLSQDIAATATDEELTVNQYREINLDLAGFTLTGALTKDTRNAGVIEVEGKLTIKDSSAGKTGTITCGDASGFPSPIIVKAGGELTMESGNISGNKTEVGGVIVEANGTFTMNGGSISNNVPTNDNDNADVGGVYVHSGTYADDEGGIFTMNGGTISGNTANSSAVFVTSGGLYGTDGIFNMNGGTISGNTAEFATVNLSGTFNMSGGKIIDNTGEGVQNWPNSTFNIKGDVTISNNIDDAGANKNAGLTSSYSNIVAPLDESAKIGVHVYSYPHKFAEGDNAKEYIDNFTSDNPDCYIGMKDGDTTGIWMDLLANQSKSDVIPFVNGITFHPNNGKDTIDELFPSTGTITVPTVEFSGYTFGGWYNNTEFIGTALTEDDIKALTVPTKLYAKWTNADGEVITIVGGFIITGGTKDIDYTYIESVLTVKTDTPITIKNIDTDTALTARIEVAKDCNANITLAGVNVDDSKLPWEIMSTGAFTVEWQATANITLADGTVNTLHGGDVPGLMIYDQDSVTLKGTGELRATTAQIHQPAILGEYRGQDGTGTRITIADTLAFATSYDNLPDDSVIYTRGTGTAGQYTSSAQYARIKAYVPAVIFNKNNGEGMISVPIPETGTITAPTVEFSGCVFAGWYNNAEFTGDALTTSEIEVINVPTTLYAKWTRNDKAVLNKPIEIRSSTETTDKLKTEGWKWDKDTKTLTLDGLTMYFFENLMDEDGYPISNAISVKVDDDIIVKLEDGSTNFITGISTAFRHSDNEKNVTFDGNGSLTTDTNMRGLAADNVTINGGTYDLTVSGPYDSAGIMYTEELHINGGDVTLTAPSGPYSYSITKWVLDENGYPSPEAGEIKTTNSELTIKAGTDKDNANDTSYTGQPYVNVKAPVAVDPDRIAVDTAKGLIAGGTYTFTQATANTEGTAKAEIAKQLNAIPGMSDTGIVFDAADITINKGDFTAANNGTNGSCNFTVNVKKGTETATTDSKTASIIATPVQNVSGKIVDKDGAVVEGAGVKITGNNVEKTATTDANGEFTIDGVPNGIYTVILTKDGKTQTTSVTVDGNKPIADIVFIALGDKNTSIVVGADTPPTTAGNLENMFDGTELETDKVEIKLVVEKTDAPEDKEEVDFAIFGQNKLGMYLDIELLKTVNDGTAQNIQPPAGETVTITIQLPAEHRNKAPYQIIHVYNGKTEIITPIYNSTFHTLTFEASSFSTYAYTYTDASIEVHTLTVDGVGTSGSANGEYANGNAIRINAGTKDGYTFTGWTSTSGGIFADASSASTTFTMPDGDVTITANWVLSQTTPPTDIPQTGDSSNTPLFVVLMCISVLGMGTVFVFRKKWLSIR